MASAMILCAGYGTRLEPLTRELPKPLVPVGDRPILRHITDALSRHGFQQALINTHHLPRAFEGFDAGSLELTRLFEPDILGTAGALSFARPQLSGAVLVWNGDILTDPPVAQLLHAATHHSVCLLVEPTPADSPSNVGLDTVGRVVRLRQEAFGPDARSANYVGVMAINQAVLAEMPERGCLIGDVCLPRLRAGLPVAALSTTTGWHDIGSLAAYQAANLSWLHVRQLDAFVHPDANVEQGVILEQSIVHAGAYVDGTGSLLRCVVWPGARVEAPLRDACVTSHAGIVKLKQG